MLVASAAALPLLFGVAAAGPRTRSPADPLAGRPPLGHDVLTLQAVIAAEENMIDLYRTAIGDPGNQGPGWVRMLRSLLTQERHT